MWNALAHAGSRASAARNAIHCRSATLTDDPLVARQVGELHRRCGLPVQGLQHRLLQRPQLRQAPAREQVLEASMLVGTRSERRSCASGAARGG